MAKKQNTKLVLADTKVNVTDAKITKIDNWLASNYKTFNPASGVSTYALIVAHGVTPCTAADARIIADRFLALKGMPSGSLSAGSIWHSVKNKVARSRPEGSARARYDADKKIAFGGAILTCTIKAHGTTRSKCARECLQGLAFNGKQLAEYIADVPKVAKRTKTGTRKRNSTKGTKGPKATATPANTTTGGTPPVTDNDSPTVTAPSVL